MSKKATIPADKLKHPRALQKSGVKPPFLYASFILTRRKRGPFWSSSSNNLKAARRVLELKTGRSPYSTHTSHGNSNYLKVAKSNMQLSKKTTIS
jgi:hypothetical protein